MKSAAASSERAGTAIVLVGSAVTAIAGELAVKAGGYSRVLAIARRGASTTLPVLEGGSELVDTMKYLKARGARAKIREFRERITGIVGGEPFDCFIHHSTNAFSQLLSSHPLCRRYYYIEEGLTAMLGTKFGRPKKRILKKLLWKIRSMVFFGNQIDKYRPFFDTTSANYGGACALSRAAFPGFPGRIQLPYDSLEAVVAPPADIIIFPDSQYIRGGCREEAYVDALRECLERLPGGGSSAAIKFHPVETDGARKGRIISAIASLGRISGVEELPADFAGERMALDPGVTVVVGTSGVGFYIGERGFPTYTFAHLVALRDPGFSKVVEDLPAGFLDVCRPI